MATLELYLIRHGIAAEGGEKYPDDTKRPLTSEGVARLKQAAKALDAIDVGFDQIITSPLVRARQTADVMAAAMSAGPPVATTAALAPEGTPEAVVQELGKHTSRTRIALVGHEPNMGELAAHLIGATAPIAFKKGGICRIDFDARPPDGVGQLRWLITPKMLRRMA